MMMDDNNKYDGYNDDDDDDDDENNDNDNDINKDICTND
jgi:hypothetical protein